MCGLQASMYGAMLVSMHDCDEIYCHDGMLHHEGLTWYGPCFRPIKATVTDTYSSKRFITFVGVQCLSKLPIDVKVCNSVNIFKKQLYALLSSNHE